MVGGVTFLVILASLSKHRAVNNQALITCYSWKRYESSDMFGSGVITYCICVWSLVLPKFQPKLRTESHFQILISTLRYVFFSKEVFQIIQKVRDVGNNLECSLSEKPGSPWQLPPHNTNRPRFPHQTRKKANAKKKISQVIGYGGSLWWSFTLWEHSVVTEEVCVIVSEQQLGSLWAVQNWDPARACFLEICCGLCCIWCFVYLQLDWNRVQM